MPCHLSRFFVLLLLLLLTSCGGGSSSDDSESMVDGDESDLGASEESSEAASVRLQSCGFNGGILRIMSLGDSITEAEAGYSSYRFALWKSLADLPCNVDFVGSRRGVSDGRRDGAQLSPLRFDFDQDHEGHWGFRADELLENVVTWMRTSRPDVVFLHAGTEDILQFQDVSSTLLDISRIIDRIRSVNPNVAIAVAKLIPNADRNGRIEDFNSRLDELIQAKSERTSPLVVADHFSRYPLELNYDGRHPGPEGESRMAATWVNSLLSLIVESGN